MICVYKYFPVRLWSYAVTFWRLLEVTPSELKPFLTTERLPRAFARKVMDESATWLKLDKQIVCTIYKDMIQHVRSSLSHIDLLVWSSNQCARVQKLELTVRAYNHGHRARKRSKLLWMHLGRFSRWHAVISISYHADPRFQGVLRMALRGHKSMALASWWNMWQNMLNMSTGGVASLA